MGVVTEAEGILAAKFRVLFPHLDERQRRLLMGAEARALGHGGIRLVARAAGVAESTVSRGVSDLDAGEEPLGRTRRVGGGRKRLVDLDPGLRVALLALVEPDMRGDPMSPLRWTTKSTRNLAEELTLQGWRISADTVADVLRGEGFSLQANAKTIEGKQHPDRDAQFRYLNEQVKDHQATGDPVVSVDTKKKELVGLYKNGGREWQPAGEPVQVNTHDFPDREVGKAIPYGVYDVTADTGWVNVGCDHDTAAFAVASIRRWWSACGAGDYPHARRLLITADAGGSNGYRTRAWKTELAALAAETGLEVTVCHLPPGTSKWNKIEHRLFSHITMNWRGRPLTSHDVIVQSIAATTTRTGLSVHAELDTGTYPTGIQINDAQITTLPMKRHRFHGDWNYTLHPHHEQPPPPPAQHSEGHHSREHAPDKDLLSHPELTGMPRHQLDDMAAELAESQARHREQTRRARRGTERRRAAGAGPPIKLTDADRVLATVLYLRKLCTQAVLAELFNVDRRTITIAVAQTRPLLEQHGYAITPSTARFPTPADLIAFLADTPPQSEIKSAC
ncbi:ISAzo13 family transposase [Micromonospora sp. SL1-18]|uniref:ISAzo13 family transposase n=1 Tax=Micromonospora sp. SL1-18 TaxID=3399128 RepID=UPI003A4D9A50